MSAAYEFHPEARIDLREIVDYIADDNPDASDNVLSDILRTLTSLARFPQLGHSRTDLTSRPLRFITVRNYLIAYAPDEKPLWVVAVIHGHRNPRVMAAILRSREDRP